MNQELLPVVTISQPAFINHADLPSIANASLPSLYSKAQTAIAECDRIDECKNWADKAQALASYAKQANNRDMYNTALRIIARAYRRCGQLLEEIKKGNGQNQNIRADTGPNVETRKTSAQGAGLSPRQAKDAIRIAHVDDDAFESQVDSDTPPTKTHLAEQGTTKAVPHYVQRGITKEAFQAGMYFRGSLKELANKTKEFDAQDIIDGSTAKERADIRRYIGIIDQFNDKLMVKIS